MSQATSGAGRRGAIDRHDARTAALGGLLDDEAVLPPSTHGLEDALASHRGHHTGQRRWLIGRFMISLGLAPVLTHQLGRRDVLDVGVVLPPLPPDGTRDQRLSGIRRVVEDDRVHVSAVEATIDGAAPGESLVGLLADIAAAGVPADTPIAIEVPIAHRPVGEVLDRLDAVAGQRSLGNPLLVKVRCRSAGDTLATADELAGLLMACAEHGLPLKATSGLERPTPADHRTHPGQPPSHGFLNVLAATAATLRGVDHDALVAILERRAEEVTLSSTALVVGEEAISGAELLELRRGRLVAVGCTDVFEPITDLARMGALLPTGGLA